MWDDFTEYILNEVGDEDVKIAEIAVGKFDKIAETLSSKDNITLIKTDILPKDSSVLKDDITNPNMCGLTTFNALSVPNNKTRAIFKQSRK